MRAHVLLIAGIAALGGLLFGYDTGIISAALLFIGDSFPISVVGKQIVTAPEQGRKARAHSSQCLGDAHGKDPVPYSRQPLP